MAVLRRSLSLAVVPFIVSCASSRTMQPQKQPPEAHLVAFVHANVIPMDSERVLRDYTVVVAGGGIAQVGPASSTRVPAGAKIVDASGRYLLPALCDMHVHIVDQSWETALPPDAKTGSKDLPLEDFLFPYIANGVTTVQSLAATPEEIPLREKIAKGEMLAPRLILGRMIDGPKNWPPPISAWVDNPAEAREAVIQAKAAGYDRIKVYSSLSKESYDAIIATAKEQKIDVIGHVPMSVSVEYAVDAGEKFIAHTEEIAKHAEKYDPEHVSYYADFLTKREVWITPTLVTTRTILGYFDEYDSIFTRPESVWFRHPLQVGLWSFLAPNIYAPIPKPYRAKLREAFVDFQRPLTKALSERGGRLMAGSDAMMIGLYPGFALHGELRELVAAGLTPYQALRTSTTNPFDYLGEGARRGTIEAGKDSDLLLVDGNPLDGIEAVQKIAGVLVHGRWIARDEIDARMKAIATASYNVPAGTVVRSH